MENADKRAGPVPSSLLSVSLVQVMAQIGGERSVFIERFALVQKAACLFCSRES